jgi:hypothetical protein
MQKRKDEEELQIEEVRQEQAIIDTKDQDIPEQPKIDLAINLKKAV